MAQDLTKYREHLVASHQKAQEDYDKTVVLLSGGALGVSFAFVDKYVQQGPITRPGLLFAAWVLWAFSLTSVLASYFLSRIALLKTIDQVDNGLAHSEQFEGIWSRAVETFNALAGLAFFLGVILTALFVRFNLGVR